MQMVNAWPARAVQYLQLVLNNPKDAASFYSGCWKISTNPDLAFATVDLDNRLADRCILIKATVLI